MKISALASIAFLTATAATCKAGDLPVAAPALPRPNVLYIAVDDLRLNIGCFGDTAAVTSNIDTLAAHGTRFAHAYVLQAVCNPSRQSMLTGRRPDTIRVWDLLANSRKTLPGVISLHEHFKRNGYGTQGIGKIYHDDTRAPFIIATTDERPRGVLTDALVEALDIYPTLVELCGLPRRASLEGKSLVPNLGEAIAIGRDAARSQFPRPWPLNKDGSPAVMGYAVRTTTHRYVEWRKFGTSEVVARELYAYEGDQLFETENLAARPDCAELVRTLACIVTQNTP